jgi:hypothetical protein
MGNDLFGIDIAGILADAIGDGVLEVTIERPIRAPARDPDDLTGGFAPGAPETWQCRGFFEDFSANVPPSVEIETGDRKAVLIGDTIPADLTIRPGDKITVHEAKGPVSLYAIQLIHRDPAAAIFQYLCRDRGPEPA